MNMKEKIRRFTYGIFLLYAVNLGLPFRVYVIKGWLVNYEVAI